MKLIWRIVISMGAVLLLVLPIWSFLFHKTIISEVNDEMDDALELFSENIISRVLRNQPLPAADNGTNNTYSLDTLTPEQAASRPHLEYSNEMVYVHQKHETEPARVLRCIFQDNNDQYYLLTASAPSVESSDLSDAITMWIVILFLFCLLTVLILCSIIVWNGTRPLYKLLHWIDNQNISKNIPILDNPTKIKEYRLLNQAVMESAKKGRELYLQQKEFIGNASHELQTPIAICQNRLELLTDSNLTEEQFSAAMKMSRSLSQLSRLNKELLMLSKIENGQCNTPENIDLAATITSLADDFSSLYSQSGISSSLQIEARENSQDGIFVFADPGLISLILTNLVKNAFRHNIKGGQVLLKFFANGKFEVSNNSEDGELDRNHLFERFHQGRKQEGSTGLGLALSQAAAKELGTEIVYSFENGFHHFSVNFSNLLS